MAPGRGQRNAPGPVLVPVASLLAEPVGSQRTVTLADVWIEAGAADGPRQATALGGSLRLDHTNRGVYAVGTFTTTLATSCARCLRDIEVPVEVVLEEEILPSIDLVSGGRIAEGDEPEIARLTDHHEIDLGMLLGEGLSLVDPIAPLCSPDCPGLCPTCGLELASGDHDHGEPGGDPRLAALRGLWVDGDGETG
jgi:uncharacterized protein